MRSYWILNSYIGGFDSFDFWNLLIIFNICQAKVALTLCYCCIFVSFLLSAPLPSHEYSHSVQVIVHFVSWDTMKCCVYLIWCLSHNTSVFICVLSSTSCTEVVHSRVSVHMCCMTVLVSCLEDVGTFMLHYTYN